MKWSTKILISTLILISLGLLASNLILKREFDKVDKNDLYWDYVRILETPFEYVRIEGGNKTKIAFEQSPNCSVRVSRDWQRVRPIPIEAKVVNDTLVLKFTYVPKDQSEENWMHWLTLVRIFSPRLIAVKEHNANLEMFKVKQPSIRVDLSGKSSFELESFLPDLDSLKVTAKDSSEVVFEMSPEYGAQPAEVPKRKLVILGPGQGKINRSESFNIQSLQAEVSGYSILDVGHAQIQAMRINIADSAGIVLSGQGLRTFSGK